MLVSISSASEFPYFFASKKLLRQESYWWKRFPKRALIVIDEVHRYLGKNVEYGSLDEEQALVDYLSQHRHEQQELYFLTQHTAQSATWLCFNWFGMMFAMNTYHANQLAGSFCSLLMIVGFVAWIGQLVRYAGIPRKRYWGFAVFGTLYAVLYLAVAVITRVVSLQTGDMQFGGYFYLLIVFVMSCFIAMSLSGIIGLRVFRKSSE